MKNKRGFTLIELLAVIVILGLLAVLIIPKVNRTVKESRNSVNMNSAYNLVRTADNYYLDQKSMLKKFDGCSYDFTNNTNTCDGFDFSGDKPEVGRINISKSGKIEMAIKFGDKCYLKEEQDSNVVAYDYDEDICMVSRPVTLSVGDVVRMTPSLSSYTTDSDMTGYSNSQTINPQELNIWRVIRVNDDGTYEAISEYVSSVDVYFEGVTGYKNYTGYLNVLASKYENSDFTVGSRYVGYSTQTEYLTDTTVFDGSMNQTSWYRATYDFRNEHEQQGGGDYLFADEISLLRSVYGSTIGIKAYRVGTTEYTSYWLASRFYTWNTATQCYFWGVLALANGSYGVSSNPYSYIRYYLSGWNDVARAFPLRPVVVLKSSLVAKGKGTLDNPYVLKSDI